jgi:hypothetical protein
MRIHRSLRAALLGLIMVLGTTLVMHAAAPTSAVEAIRNELLKLPYYSVFDYLAFSYDKGTVTLMGYAYRPSLKEDAVRAVKRAPGVDQVVDKIEVLPVSPNDDEIRWKTYYAIYRDPFLSKYAPGGGMLWGHRHALGGAGLRGFPGGMFPGMEPGVFGVDNQLIVEKASNATR